MHSHNSYIGLLLLLKSIMLVHSNTFNRTNDDVRMFGPEIAHRIVQRFYYAWPQGIVPYYIDMNSYDSIIARRVRLSMNIIEIASCVKFVDLSLVKDKIEELHITKIKKWLHISNPTQERECVHHVVVEPDADEIILLVLGFECMQHRDIMHALLHALGFKDEVSHPQRDHFIRVLWENIQPKYRELFHISMDETPYKSVEYDPMSVMQFHDRAYSFNGGPTIAPAIPGLVIMPSEGLSILDVMKLHLAFGHECNKRKVDKLVDTCQNAMRVDGSERGNEDESAVDELKEKDNSDEDESAVAGFKEEDNSDENENAIPLEAVPAAKESNEDY